MLRVNSNILLLTKQLQLAPKGGREMLSRLNYDTLLNIFGKRLILFELSEIKLQQPNEIFNAFRGNIDGLTTQNIQQIIYLIKREKVRQVFVDGSNLGGFIEKLKQSLPEVEVVTFFHNVEARFFWGSLKTNRTFRALAIFIVNFLAERKAARLSDKRICLSKRDDRLLKSLYGNGATHIAPMALRDKFTENLLESQLSEEEPFALFVGGTFYANLDGITWFVKNVARQIDIKVCIVGKGMEHMREQLEIPERVKVIGQVDDLSEWYRRARFVIAPIFEGSGMKTKVAEALMYGKKVVGTPEAFSGYEVGEDVGWVCRTAEEFVTAMQLAYQEIHSSFDPKLRAIYVENYSFEAAEKRLGKILL
jgi:glycosyltransferase involved in cell wall biosynthesis